MHPTVEITQNDELFAVTNEDLLVDGKDADMTTSVHDEPGHTGESVKRKVATPDLNLTSTDSTFNRSGQSRHHNI